MGDNRAFSLHDIAFVPIANSAGMTTSGIYEARDFVFKSLSPMMLNPHESRDP